MKKLKLIIVLFISIGFVQCNILKLEKSPPFKVQGGVYNYWVGGQPGVSGINVNINYLANDTVIFENMYFQRKTTKIETRTVAGKTHIIGHFNTSTREDILIIEGQNKTTKQEIKKDKFPFNLNENEAVISYKEGVKTKYVKVEKLKKTKRNFYQ